MMNCKLCATVLEEGARNCPNCGHEVGAKVGPEKGKGVKSTKTIPPTPVRLDLDLEEEDVEREPEPEVGVEFDLEEEVERVIEAPKGSVVSTPIFTLDAAGLRKMLARQPELLEPGLNIVTDEKGRLVGSGYATDVGTIDLLARDAQGGLVVVTVVEFGQDEEVVAEMLQRIGWVRKNLGKGKQKVRGIVVLEQVPKNLSYAAAAVADTIAFKTYWVALTFGDVEV
ncbi:MAG: endonuclease NucS domain-containing protein [candidate division NC10 bacterium]